MDKQRIKETESGRGRDEGNTLHAGIVQTTFTDIQ
jgi:hypothetical protein